MTTSDRRARTNTSTERSDCKQRTSVTWFLTKFDITTGHICMKMSACAHSISRLYGIDKERSTNFTRGGMLLYAGIQNHFAIDDCNKMADGIMTKGMVIKCRRMNDTADTNLAET
jgi:hypothetical protein